MSCFNRRDTNARFTVKRSKTYSATRRILEVDNGSGLRQAKMTSANLHDGRTAHALIRGDEQALFADTAYTSQVFAARSMRDDGG